MNLYYSIRSYMESKRLYYANMPYYTPLQREVLYNCFKILKRHKLNPKNNSEFRSIIQFALELNRE